MPQSKITAQAYGYANWWEFLASRAMRHDIATRPDLSRAARDLFGFLWRAKRTLRFITFSIKFLANELHYHPRTIQRAIKQLIDAQLLAVEYRKSPKNDPTSNRYFPQWQAYSAEVETACQTPHRHSTSTDDIVPHHSGSPSRLSSAPSVPGGEVAQCRDPRAPEAHKNGTTSRIAKPHRKAIQNNVLRKNDHPGSSPRTAESGSTPPPTDDVVLTIPKSWQIHSQRIAQWLHRYGSQRVQDVAQWILQAPPGRIRFPGGWMYRALHEGWAAPSWVQGQKDQQTQQRDHIEQIQHEMERARQREEAYQQERASSDQLWAMVARALHSPAIADAVTERAKRLASDALKSLTPVVFRPESPTWRAFIIQAWKELYGGPDLVKSATRQARMTS
ncbi:MAG: hypothetical protein OWR62_11650 [Sulfobacillus thermotolerans]|nr:hypothetical protein [Sulfobacillus thermotolerans]